MSNGKIPLYIKIQDYIREKIEGGEWGPGYQLPTEQMLCEQFGVSRITVVRALDRLSQEGLVTREQGRGSFVRVPTVLAEPLTLMSFKEEMERRGAKPSTRVMVKRIELPSRLVKETLKLGVGERVWKFERLLLADEVPVGIELTHIPYDQFKVIGDMLLDNVSLYQLLKTQSGVEPESAIETYSSVLLRPREYAMLELEPGSPAFSVERLTYGRDSPIEFSKSVMRSDYYHYTIRLTRNLNGT